MSRNKVIIIGGGLGGLMSGALLAKEGYDVSVFEKHHVIGGGLQSYKRFGATFDTCMHVFGGMHEGGNIRRICEYLGIMDAFSFLDIDSDPCMSLYIASDDSNYEIGKGREGFVNSLAHYFPEERENLEKYVSVIYGIMEELDLFHLRKTTHCIFDHSEEYKEPADQLIDRYFQNEQLKSIVACFNTLYAGEKGVSPSFLHAAISMIFHNGASRIVGGYSRFAEALVEHIRRYGGEVKTDSKVTAINTSNGAFKSIELADGEEIAGNYCISSIPPTCLLKIIDNSNIFSKTCRESIEERNDSLSAFIINVKLKKNTLPFFNNIRFYYTDCDSAWKASDGSTIDKFMYMTPPEDNQGEWASTLSITAVMDWKAVAQWEDSLTGHRPADYYEWKEKICRDVIVKMNSIIPGFSEMIEDIDSASPLTIRDFTSVRHGAMCGFRNESENIFNSFLPVKTKMKNLLLTGQSINLHGFCGVSLTAIQTAETILGEDYITKKL